MAISIKPVKEQYKIAFSIKLVKSQYKIATCITIKADVSPVCFYNEIKT